MNTQPLSKIYPLFPPTIEEQAELSSEISYYASKLGLTSDSEKREFSHLFNFIFNTTALPNKCMEANLANFGTWSSYPDEIISFQTELRKHFRRSPGYIDLSAVFPEVETEFESWVNDKVSHYDKSGSKGDSHFYKITIHRQMTRQKEWIRRVNELRRESFQKGARDEAELRFKIQLRRQFPVQIHYHWYEEAEILQFAKELEAKVVDEFLAMFPSFEEKGHQLAGWAAELRKACSKTISTTLELNKRSREMRDMYFAYAIARYKDRMAALLEKHPLAGEQGLRGLHTEAKEADTYLNICVGCGCKDSVWKEEWDERVDKEFTIFETKWRAERDGKIAAVLSGVREDAGKRYKEIFKSQVEPGDVLDELLSLQVSEALTHDLDKVDDSKNRGLNQSTTPKPGPACSKRLRGTTTAAAGEPCK